jgi:hypothetical protein
MPTASAPLKFGRNSWIGLPESSEAFDGSDQRILISISVTDIVKAAMTIRTQRDGIFDDVRSAIREAENVMHFEVGLSG